MGAIHLNYLKVETDIETEKHKVESFTPYWLFIKTDKLQKMKCGTREERENMLFSMGKKFKLVD